MDLPPAAFDHPFAGRLVISDNYGGELTAIGGPCYPWTGSKACAFKIGDVGYIFSIKGEIETNPSACYRPNDGAKCRLLRHEIGHLNGWPADHPR